MEREFAVLEGMIAGAAARIGAEYFQLPVADADSVYRERVYCYELYHQLQCGWDGFPFSLGGEVDKAGHPHFSGGPYARSKPDLLVHEPGNMDRNLACVEVKPCGASVDEVRDDLTKLTWFCRKARYHRGVFLVYGTERAETPEYGKLLEKLRRASEGNGCIDLARISVLAHAGVGQRAERVNP
jgi:hypothetical protein